MTEYDSFKPFNESDFAPALRVMNEHARTMAEAYDIGRREFWKRQGPQRQELDADLQHIEEALSSDWTAGTMSLDKITAGTISADKITAAPRRLDGPIDWTEPFPKQYPEDTPPTQGGTHE